MADITSNVHLTPGEEAAGTVGDLTRSAVLALPTASVARQAMAYTGSIGFGGRLSAQGLYYRGAPRFTGISTLLGRRSGVGGKMFGTAGGGALLTGLGMDPGAAFGLSAGVNILPSLAGRQIFPSFQLGNTLFSGITLPGARTTMTGIGGFMEAFGMTPPKALTTLEKGGRISSARFGFYNPASAAADFIEGKSASDLLKVIKQADPRMVPGKTTTATSDKIVDAAGRKLEYTKTAEKNIGGKTYNRFKKLKTKEEISKALRKEIQNTSVLKEVKGLKGVFGVKGINLTETSVKDVYRGLSKAMDINGKGIQRAQTIVSAFEEASLNAPIFFGKQTGAEAIGDLVKNIVGQPGGPVATAGGKAVLGKATGLYSHTTAAGQVKALTQLENIFGLEATSLQGLVKKGAGEAADFTKVQDLLTGKLRKARFGKLAQRGVARVAGVAGVAAIGLGFVGLGASVAQKGLKRLSDSINNINNSLRTTEFGGRGAFNNEVVTTERQRSLATMQYLRTGRDFIGMEARLIAEGS